MEQKGQSNPDLIALILELNKRLATLENLLSNNNNSLYEIRKRPSPPGSLGGEALSYDGNATLIISYPFCAVCGRKLEEEKIVLCFLCQATLCAEHSIYWQNHSYCFECYKGMLPMGKDFFLVLFGVYLRLNEGQIADFSRIGTKQDVKYIVSKLIASGWVKKEGFIFKKAEITANGIIALDQCYRYFRQDADVINFLREVEDAFGEQLDKSSLG